jgi:Transposase DDE domain group 1
MAHSSTADAPVSRYCIAAANDATDDPVHGEQEGRFFHGYYDCYCYLPLYVFCGRHLLDAKLRRASVDAADGAVEAVARIVAQIRRRWCASWCAPIRAGALPRSASMPRQPRAVRRPDTRSRARTRRHQLQAPRDQFFAASAARKSSSSSRLSRCHKPP